MSRKNAFPRFAALAGLLMSGLALQTLTAQNQPDNTGVNKQDRSSGAVTADQQKNDHTDRYLTQQIRKAVMADKSLSTYGHNVKIVSQDGAVTLKGPVHSEDERKSIMAKAEQIAGTGKVTDQMSVTE
jgi:hyperosmotically inducible periplasmic protein